MVPWRPDNLDKYQRICGEIALSFRDDLVGVIEEMEPTPEAVFAADDDVLGTYQPMASPGIITLYWERIGAMFWHTLLNVSRAGNSKIPFDHVECLARLLVTTVYVHEQFHHACDVMRHLAGAQCEKEREEALAVAWSYHQAPISVRGRSSQLARNIRKDFMKAIFRYTAPGYRDWYVFKDLQDLRDGITRYLVPAGTHKFLLGSGVNVDEIVHGLVSATVQGRGAVELIAP